MAGPANQARSSWLDRANRFLVGAAALSLLFMVAVITAGVAMRYVFAAPILGLNEIVQLTSVAVVMLTLPWATAVGAHVRVDVLDRVIGRSGRFLGDVLSRALSAFVLGVLVWRAVFKALDALEFHDATNMLALPIWPFHAILAAGMVLCMAVLLGQLVTILREGASRD